MLDDILDFYNTNLGNSDIVSEVKEMFDYKYIKQGADFGLDFTEGENYKPSSKTFFIPGKIYTFFFKRKTAKKGADNFPIILVTKVGNDNKLLGTYIEGINFNKIPIDNRASVLDSYMTKFEPELVKMWDSAEKGETYVSAALISVLSSSEALNNTFDKAVGASYSRYYLSSIERPMLFEMDDWKFIPFYVDEGLDLAKIVAKFKSLVSSSASDAIKDSIKKFKKSAKKKVAQLIKNK